MDKRFALQQQESCRGGGHVQVLADSVTSMQQPAASASAYYFSRTPSQAALKKPVEVVQFPELFWDEACR